jgi:putative two-component system response regulator
MPAAMPFRLDGRPRALDPRPPQAVGAGTQPAGARHRIMVVDDDADVRNTMARMLRSFGHDVEIAADGLDGLAKLALNPDLVMLDADMPGLDGFDVTSRIRNDPTWADLPIVMITGLNNRVARLRAIEAGVNDFITKPVDLAELRLRTTWLLRMKDSTDRLRESERALEAQVAARTAALRIALERSAAAERETYRAHLDSIRRLVVAAEYRDHDTAMHIERIGRYSALIGERLGLPPGRQEVLRHAASLHDIGKIGVPDAILRKPGPLDEAERRLMQKHTIIGARILEGSLSDVLRVGSEIALTHHERWDGAGYPHRLAGRAIPLHGRICAVSDVFDALTTDRPYRAAVPVDTVFAMLEAERGRQFDPDVLDAFLADRDEVVAIRRELMTHQGVVQHAPIAGAA